MLLSLLYDNILIQDEVFALSNRMARWFLKEENANLLAKCFDLGTLVVLKHPLNAYPTDDLRELSILSPILARAKYIQKHGTRNELRFQPSDQQIRFYGVIDSFLRTRPRAQRFVGSQRKLDIMLVFSSILRDVLSSKRYAKWRDSAFRGISDQMAEDFVSFIAEPESSIAKLKESKPDYVALVEAEGRPVFNRSLAYQLASLYPARAARAMQRLIQTTFAAPFSWRENSAGRYGPALRELLWLPTTSKDMDLDQKEQVVSVEAHVDVRILLPNPNRDFADAIATARRSEPGRRLRKAVRQVGQDIDFARQKEAWSAMADELASAVTQPKPFDVRVAAVRIGKTTITGSVTKAAFDFVRGAPIDIPVTLSGAFFNGACRALGVCARHLHSLFQNDLQRQELRRQLEQAVRFRCTSLAMPPTVLDPTELR